MCPVCGVIQTGCLELKTHATIKKPDGHNTGMCQTERVVVQRRTLSRDIVVDRGKKS